jgi:hypothetical protein
MTKSTRSLLAKRLKDAPRFRPSSTALDAVIKEFYQSLDTPVSLSCFLLYENKEFDQLVKKEIDPRQYNDKFQFRDDFTAISFLRKSEFVKTSINKKEVALSTFIKAEESCRETNSRFRNLALDPLFRGPNVWLLNATTRKIAMILGEIDFDRLLDDGSFGPGASTLISGRDTSAVRKFREERQITASLYQLVKDILPLAYPLWFRDGKLGALEFREFSKVITVPKNAKTDRTIAVEPGLNLWFQKGIGLAIRRRLRRNGLNLDIDLINQSKARKGSSDSSIATVDFSAASDTISSRVIEEIFPPQWFQLLDICRSRRYELNKEVHSFHKFSSMGNGFTFELETLIFYASALACCEYLDIDSSDVSVFGDDVTLPSGAYQLFVDFSKFLGFQTNTQKSFSDGYFRESCGSYYFDGLDVKPYFFKKALSNAYRIFGLANSILELSTRRNSFYGRDAKLQGCHSATIDLLPRHLRVKGERSAGEGCIHSDFDECTPSRLRNGLEGYSFWAFSFHAKTVETESPALLVARLRYPSTEEENNSYSLRAVTKKRFSRFSVQQWYNFGPWL